MPTLPGNSVPLAIAPVGKRRRGQGQAKSTGKSGKDKDDPPQDIPSRIAKKDQELHQIDLMRKQVLLGQTTDTWLHHEMSPANGCTCTS